MEQINNWSDEEVVFLQQNYGKIPAQDIANFLGRKFHQVCAKANRMGLAKKDNRWNKEHVEYLKSNYGILETEFIAKHLCRSLQNIYDKASSLGLKITPEYRKKYIVKKRKGYQCQGYMRIGVNGKKLLMHRLVWEKHNGKIPEGMAIHHIDGNKLNNNIENLQLITNEEHNRLHHQERDSLTGKFIGVKSNAQI